MRKEIKNIIADRATINVNFTIFYCGRKEADPGEFKESHVLDHYVLHYINDGKGTLKVSGREYRLSKGQGFLIAPNVSVSYEADKSEPWSYTYVAFAGHLVDKYMSRAKLSSQTPVYSYNEDEFIENRMAKLVEYSKASYNRYCKMMSELYAIVAKLIDYNRAYNDDMVGAQSADYYVRKAMGFIDMYYHQKITVETISRYLGISRKYLHQVFKSTINKSPKEYIVAYRMEKAGALIEAGAFSVAEISRSVGYPDMFHFSKMFKKEYGVSPSKYKKKVSEINKDENYYRNLSQDLLIIINSQKLEISNLKENLAQSKRSRSNIE